jgi:hypothetical protein
MRALLVWLCGAAALIAQAVEGTVTNQVTKTPLDGVSVTLNSGNAPAYKVTTDAHGTFRIEGVKPGTYTPHFQKRGFMPAITALRPFQIVEGGQPVGLRGELVPMGKLSGRVLDAEGKPVPGASVEMLSSFGGPTVTADARGSFSIEDLTPATYTLAARPPRGIKPAELDGGRRLALVMTYYPGVVQRSGASRITIAPGADIFGQDVRLVAAPVHRIHGTALDHKGEPVAGVVLMLSDATRLTTDAAGDVQITSGEDGAFEFRDIPAGEWRISASADRSGARLKAFQSVEIADRDVDRFKLRLGLPFSIQGTITFEGAAVSPSPMTGTVVMLAPSVGGSELSNGRPNEEGKFTAEGIYPGLYQVIPIQPGAQYYLGSIRLGEQESTDGRVEFFSGAIPLNIVYRADGGSVRGTVEECGTATVALVPTDLTLRRRPYIRNAKCRANGGYEFTAVRPGEYYVLALNPSDPAFSFMSTDVDQGRLNAATRVSVRSNEATQADIHVLR